MSLQLRQGECRTLVRAPLPEKTIRGQIVEVLLPKCSTRNEKEHLFLKGHIIVKAETVCLQLGEHNSVHVNLVDLAMPDDVSAQLTKVSDNDELVVRVLRRHDESEEFILITDSSGIHPSIDICADFVRIIPPADEKPRVQGFTVFSQIDARHALVGDRAKTVINPGKGFSDVFDSTRPILRVLRAPDKLASVFHSTRDFPNFERDHRLVLQICKNRCDGHAFEYCFDGKSLSSAGSKKAVKRYHDVEVMVREINQNGKMEVNNGVMFKRDSSFDNLQGLVAFWFRFHKAIKRYTITFSLWEKQTGRQESAVIVDEIDVTVETSEWKRPPSNHRKHICPAKEIPEEASLQCENRSKPTSLLEESHTCTALERREQFSPNDNGNQLCLQLPISRETNFSGEELPGNNHMTTETRKQTPLRRKRRREAQFPGQTPQFMPRETSVPAEVDGSVYEQSLQIMEVLGDFRDNGKWDEFDREADQLLTKLATNNDFVIAVMLEQGKAACFRNDPTSAEDFVKKASLKIPQAFSNLVSMWKGRANSYLAAIYRRKRMKFGRAQRCIDSAKKHLKNTSYLLDHACLAYEEGSLLFEQAHLPSMAEESRRCFDRSIDLCSLGLEECADSHLLSRMHDLAMMKKSILLLDLRKEYKLRGGLINEKTLLEAKQCLESLKITSVPEMTKIAQVQYHLARSDQYFREQRLVDATGHAQTAFDLSHQYGFDTCHEARVRLDFLNKFRNSN